jgi:CheY-like chemotaxis protein
MAKTILVVDDEEDNRITLKSILEKNNYSVVTAVNGADCLKRLPKQKVDLILLDIMMPGMTTRELYSKIKEVVDGTKIIYVTAVQMSEAERKELLKQKGVIDFIQKPFDIGDLIKKVKKAVS